MECAPGHLPQCPFLSPCLRTLCLQSPAELLVWPGTTPFQELMDLLFPVPPSTLSLLLVPPPMCTVGGWVSVCSKGRGVV